MNRAADRRPLRADAARNVDKIITAARQCFREHGSEVPLQTIAVTAGVGPATLFRNFADKEELVLAALHRQLGLLVDPVIEEALAAPDAADGLFRVIDALMGVASEEANLLGAVAGRRGLL
ncbi:MAG TPA: helix-turn-helix domain-containing protein, partial [Arthrobacter sp.]|nr:helix-turn-helix domain-containing protein [Arthrobacter sp.]